MKKSNRTKAIHRVGAIGVGVVAATMFVGAPALADDPDPDAQDKSCGGAVRTFVKAAGTVLKGDAKDEANGLPDKYSKMRGSCEPFRACKRACRDAKRDAKDACRGKRGKAKRKCKREARREKRSCKRGCRTEMKQSSCKSARKDFWRSMGKVVGKVARDKDVRRTGKAAVQTCRELYKK